MILIFFCIKSNFHKIYTLLILWFSVYRCHGKIDFPKNILPSFNLGTVTGVNFTLIQVWEACLTAKWKSFAWPGKNSIKPPLKLFCLYNRWIKRSSSKEHELLLTWQLSLSWGKLYPHPSKWRCFGLNLHSA